MHPTVDNTCSRDRNCQLSHPRHHRRTESVNCSCARLVLLSKHSSEQTRHQPGIYCLLKNLNSISIDHKSSSGKNVVEYGPHSGQSRLPCCSPHCKSPPSFPITASVTQVVSMMKLNRQSHSTRMETCSYRLSCPPNSRHHPDTGMSSRAHPTNPS